jgi:hypothetical protein
MRHEQPGAPAAKISDGDSGGGVSAEGGGDGGGSDGGGGGEGGNAETFKVTAPSGALLGDVIATGVGIRTGKGTKVAAAGKGPKKR